MNALQRAIEVVGTQVALAAAIGVTAQAVNQWLTKGRIPAERVLEIERATEGRVSRHDLRPDLYPRQEQAA